MRTAIFCVIVLLGISLSPGYAEEYLIKPGDTLSITVLGEPDLTRRVVVDREGKITLPIIKEVAVGNLSTSAATSEIEQRLKTYIRNPQVVVELAEPGKMNVVVSGEVQRPGTYPLSTGARLMEAVTAAGGYTPNADLSKLSITSEGQKLTTVDLSKFLLAGDTSANVILTPGDTVVVPSNTMAITGAVTVLGAIRQSGTYPLTEGLTLREAVMLAGGPTELADASNATIRHEGTSETIPVDYPKAALGDPIANVLLRPGDVIYLGARGTVGHYTIQGAVSTPGRYELQGETTLTEAIAIAGGAKDRARLGEVRVLRTTPEGVQTISADYGNIMSGRSQNLVLRDQDNVFVPQGKERTDWLRMLSLAVSIGWLLTRN